jgi:hypothetical protein
MVSRSNIIAQRLAAAVAVTLLLAGSGAFGQENPGPPAVSPLPPRNEQPAYRRSERPAAVAVPPSETAATSPVSPLPPRPPAYPLSAPSVPLGQIGAAPNPGPVTGYGPGGMGRIPGSPANPPYR